MEEKDTVHQAVSAALAGSGGRAVVRITPLEQCGLGITVEPLDGTGATAVSTASEGLAASRAEGAVYQAVRALVESCGVDRVAMIVIAPDGSVEARGIALPAGHRAPSAQPGEAGDGEADAGAERAPAGQQRGDQQRAPSAA